MAYNCKKLKHACATSMEKLYIAKMKSFTSKLKKKHRERFHKLIHWSVIYCEKRHKPRCGCLSDDMHLSRKHRIIFHIYISSQIASEYLRMSRVY